MIYTLEQFYDAIPKLHRKYKPDLLNAMDTLNITTHQLNFQTTKIIVYASLGCIDSVVNLMCLFSLRKHFNLEVSIILNTSEEYKELQRGKTPTIYGYNQNNESIWTWEQVPNVIKKIEDNAPQNIVIVEKMKYRHGGYLQQTLEELIQLL